MNIQKWVWFIVNKHLWTWPILTPSYTSRHSESPPLSETITRPSHHPHHKAGPHKLPHLVWWWWRHKHQPEKRPFWNVLCNYNFIFCLVVLCFPVLQYDIMKSFHKGTIRTTPGWIEDRLKHVWELTSQYKLTGLRAMLTVWPVI